jgi:hypothetical protein
MTCPEPNRPPVSGSEDSTARDHHACHTAGRGPTCEALPPASSSTEPPPQSCRQDCRQRRGRTRSWIQGLCCSVQAPLPRERGIHPDCTVPDPVLLPRTASDTRGFASGAPTLPLVRLQDLLPQPNRLRRDLHKLVLCDELNRLLQAQNPRRNQPDRRATSSAPAPAMPIRLPQLRAAFLVQSVRRVNRSI